MRFCAPILIAVAAWYALAADPVASPIHFAYRAIAFALDSCETPERHAPETMAGGVAVFDFDNDGDLDIFFTNGADIRTLKKTSAKYSNRLFANDGKGHFTDVTAKAGLAGTGYDMGVAIGDFDNDGFKDIFVGGVHRNTLYHNNGNGTFTDVTEKAGLNRRIPSMGRSGQSAACGWMSTMTDLLDLFVVNYVQWDGTKEPDCTYKGHHEYCHPKFYGKSPNQLFLNNGDGTFKDVSAESGIRAHPGKGMGAAMADYDHDGLPDLFVANDKVYNLFFHNKGNGKFEEVAFDVNVALLENGEFISGMGADFRDIDNDGFADIAVVALDDETFPLFKNTGKGDFIDITAASKMAVAEPADGGLLRPTSSISITTGWKDLFVTRGHVQSPLAAPRITVDQPNSVFRNLGGDRFAAFTAEAGFTAQKPSRHRGSAIGDFNGDGRLDAVVAALSAPAEIWINDSPGRITGWSCRLKGTRSNRDGIGAQIKVVTKSGTQYNHVSYASGYASSSAGPVHFGLGGDATADLIEIRWPSGTVQQLRNVPADRVVKVTEPKAS